MPKLLDCAEELAQTESTVSSMSRPGLSRPRDNLLSETQAVTQSSSQLVYLSVAVTDGDSRNGKVSLSPSKMNKHMS